MADHFAVARRRREDVEASGAWWRCGRTTGAFCATSRESAGEDGEGVPVRRHSGGWPRRDSGSIARCRMKGSKATSWIPSASIATSRRSCCAPRARFLGTVEAPDVEAAKGCRRGPVRSGWGPAQPDHGARAGVSWGPPTTNKPGGSTYAQNADYHRRAPFLRCSSSLSRSFRFLLHPPKLSIRSMRGSPTWPGMNGRELGRRALEIRPGSPIGS